MKFIFERIKDWFRYRFTPRHRYHVLKIHDPGYSDPRTELLQAMMAVVERYVEELRVNAFDEDLSDYSDVEVLTWYIRKNREWIRGGEIYQSAWLNHYMKIRSVVFWWNQVKDAPHLDCYSQEDIDFLQVKHPYLMEDKDYQHLTTETVDNMLKMIIEMRQWMWTRKTTINW